MDVMLWVLAGAALAWLARSAMRLNVSRSLLVTAIIGIIGAFFGGDVLAPILGASVGESSGFSPLALLVAGASAITCLTLSDILYERFGV